MLHIQGHTLRYQTPYPLDFLIDGDPALIEQLLAELQIAQTNKEPYTQDPDTIGPLRLSVRYHDQRITIVPHETAPAKAATFFSFLGFPLGYVTGTQKELSQEQSNRLLEQAQAKARSLHQAKGGDQATPPSDTTQPTDTIPEQTTAPTTLTSPLQQAENTPQNSTPTTTETPQTIMSQQNNEQQKPETTPIKQPIQTIITETTQPQPATQTQVPANQPVTTTKPGSMKLNPQFTPEQQRTEVSSMASQTLQEINTTLQQNTLPPEQVQTLQQRYQDIYQALQNQDIQSLEQLLSQSFDMVEQNELAALQQQKQQELTQRAQITKQNEYNIGNPATSSTDTPQTQAQAQTQQPHTIRQRINTLPTVIKRTLILAAIEIVIITAIAMFFGNGIQSNHTQALITIALWGLGYIIRHHTHKKFASKKTTHVLAIIALIASILIIQFVLLPGLF